MLVSKVIDPKTLKKGDVFLLWSSTRETQAYMVMEEPAETFVRSLNLTGQKGQESFVSLDYVFSVVGNRGLQETLNYLQSYA